MLTICLKTSATISPPLTGNSFLLMVTTTLYREQESNREIYDIFTIQKLNRSNIYRLSFLNIKYVSAYPPTDCHNEITPYELYIVYFQIPIRIFRSFYLSIS